MHDWSSGDAVDWRGISDAANYIGINLRKWGRINVFDTKEKYGTARVYCGFGWHQLHCITHPGYHHSRYPNWLWIADCTYFSRIIQRLNPVVIPCQKLVYTYFYGRALSKWPHLRSEILQGADWSELLTRYGVHTVRTDERMYETHYDWHPDNYYVRNPQSDEEMD